jgi:hypothetical protein
MEQPKSPNFQRLAIFLALFILFSAALLIGVRDIIRELVVLPLSYLFWVLGVLINYTPQIFFWLMLLLIVWQIASKTLGRKPKPTLETPLNFMDQANGHVTQGRVTFWKTRIRVFQTTRSEYFSQSFHSALGKMLLDFLAYRYRLAPRQVEDYLKDNPVDLPPEIAQYALECLRPPEIHSAGLFYEIKDFFKNIFQEALETALRIYSSITGSKVIEGKEKTVFPLVVKDRSRSMDGTSGENLESTRIRRILEFMENELEVPHDNASR